MSLIARVKEYSGLVMEFQAFLSETKSYWLAPAVFVLLLAGALIFFIEGTVVAPFIYTVF